MPLHHDVSGFVVIDFPVLWHQMRDPIPAFIKPLFMRQGNFRPVTIRFTRNGELNRLQASRETYSLAIDYFQSSRIVDRAGVTIVFRNIPEVKSTLSEVAFKKNRFLSIKNLVRSEATFLLSLLRK